MNFLLSDFHLLTKEKLREIYISVPLFTHKGINGQGILIAGSRNMPGAALLSAKAALRCGLGKLIVHAPVDVLHKVLLTVPETILSGDPNPDYVSSLPELILKCNAAAIGPGLEVNHTTSNALLQLLKAAPYPIVIDADALNILANNKNWLDFIPQNSILTPHAKEFERLAGKSKNRFERVIKAQDFAEKYNVIIVLKGHFTTIVFPNRKVYLNTTGNQGMATAGSGDVLTGILLGLLTKGYTPEHAAKLGVFLHGLAGDFALEQQSFESLIASDIIENLGKAFKVLG